MSDHKSFTSELQEYRNTQLSKDFKLAGSVMVAVLVVLFHYVYIMKKLIDNPEMTYPEIAVYFGLWGVNCCGTWYLLAYKVYPAIAGEDVLEIQKEKKYQ